MDAEQSMMCCDETLTVIHVRLQDSLQIKGMFSFKWK